MIKIFLYSCLLMFSWGHRRGPDFWHISQCFSVTESVYFCFTLVSITLPVSLHSPSEGLFSTVFIYRAYIYIYTIWWKSAACISLKFTLIIILPEHIVIKPTRAIVRVNEIDAFLLCLRTGVANSATAYETTMTKWPAHSTCALRCISESLLQVFGLATTLEAAARLYPFTTTEQRRVLQEVD